MGWIKDTLMNRKIEGESSLDFLEEHFNINYQEDFISSDWEIVAGAYEDNEFSMLSSGSIEIRFQNDWIYLSAEERMIEISYNGKFFTFSLDNDANFAISHTAPLIIDTHDYYVDIISASYAYSFGDDGFWITYDDILSFNIKSDGDLFIIQCEGGIPFQLTNGVTKIELFDDGIYLGQKTQNIWHSSMISVTDDDEFEFDLSRNSAINNYPTLVDDTHDIGSASTLDLSSNTNLFKSITLTADGTGIVRTVEITLPNSVKMCIINDDIAQSAFDLTNNKVNLVVSDGGFVDSGNGYYCRLVIEKNVAYLYVMDNN